MIGISQSQVKNDQELETASASTTLVKAEMPTPVDMSPNPTESNTETVAVASNKAGPSVDAPCGITLNCGMSINSTLLKIGSDPSCGNSRVFHKSTQSLR